MDQEKVKTEEFRVNGDAVVSEIKRILHEGNVRRITIKNEKGDTLIEIPLTVGVVGVLLLPVWAAVGAIAALAAKLTIVVERVEAPAGAAPTTAGDASVPGGTVPPEGFVTTPDNMDMPPGPNTPPGVEPGENETASGI